MRLQFQILCLIFMIFLSLCIEIYINFFGCILISFSVEDKIHAHTKKWISINYFLNVILGKRCTKNHIYPLYVFLFFHLTLDIRVSTMLQLQYIENILQSHSFCLYDVLMQQKYKSTKRLDLKNKCLFVSIASFKMSWSWEFSLYSIHVCPFHLVCLDSFEQKKTFHMFWIRHCSQYVAKTGK